MSLKKYIEIKYFIMYNRNSITGDVLVKKQINLFICIALSTRVKIRLSGHYGFQ